MKLTDHFSEAELGVEHAPIEVRGAARILCYELLEPIRERFGEIGVTSGYRPPEHNASVGGKQTSFHLYQDGKCAADFKPLVPGICLQEVFDWIRLESGLRFDKVIMEYPPGSFPEDVLAEKAKPRCIHIQLHIHKQARRQAFVGETGASQIYLPVHVAPLAEGAAS
jgi:hypothetical protein